MRIVTRPDFDGIVCAVFIKGAEKITEPILWIEPADVQNGEAQIKKGDIMANLPYDDRCSVWFDHHISNVPFSKVEGAFRIAPSAAGIVYDYYVEKGLLEKKFDQLVAQTDIIDAAKLDKDMVMWPEKYPYILLSMTLKNQAKEDEPYWNRLVEMIGTMPIEEIMRDEEVKKRAQEVIDENKEFENHLKNNTELIGRISVTDFRSFDAAPSGNRFLTYIVFPDTIASVTIRNNQQDQQKIMVSVGKSIFNNKSRVNIGKMLAEYGGGGHDGAGGCTLDKDEAETVLPEIIDIMVQNSP